SRGGSGSTARRSRTKRPRSRPARPSWCRSGSASSPGSLSADAAARNRVRRLPLPYDDVISFQAQIRIQRSLKNGHPNQERRLKMVRPEIRKTAASLAVAGALAVAYSQAHASGFALMEQNASGLGNAFAGAAAAAEDASTIFYNAAGLSLLPKGSN